MVKHAFPPWNSSVAFRAQFLLCVPFFPQLCQAGPSIFVLSINSYTFVPGVVLSTGGLAVTRVDMVLGFKRLLSNGTDSCKNNF